MPQKVQDMSQVQPSDDVKVMVVGPPGSGKSWLIRTAPKPLLVFDTDQKPASYAGIPGVFCISMADPQNGGQPSVIPDRYDWLSKLEGFPTLDVVAKACGITLSPEWSGKRIASVADDSISTLAKAAQNFILYGNKDLARVITLKIPGGGVDIRVPKGWDGWLAEAGLVEQIVLRTMALPCHYFCAIHEQAEETADSTDENVRLTGQVQLYPRRYNQVLLKYFTEKWRLDRPPGATKPTVRVGADQSFKVSTVLNLDSSEDPDISKMLAKHASRTSKPKS